MITDSRLNETFKKCLSITGAFEGASWGGTIGNFDGAGMSAFILQWNFLSTLAQLIHSMFETDPAKFNELFGGDKTGLIIPLLATAQREDLEAVINLVTYGEEFEVLEGNTRLFRGKRDIIPEWKAAFRRIGEYFGQQQMDAAEKYFDDAIAECQTFKLNTERSVAFMFDICVQRGKGNLASEQHEFLKVVKDPSYQEDDDKWLRHVLDVDTARTSSRWQADAHSRRACILNDGGVVHGKDYDLGKEFGLTDDKVL